LSIKKTVPLDQAVHLSPGKEKLEFHYTVLSFLAPEKVLFKYLLEGYDHDSVNAGTRRVVYYTNLPLGHYCSRVIACYNDGVWNETGARYAFMEESQFNPIFWFYGLLASVTVGVGFGLYRV
jgi:hypothetical protein